MRKVVGVEHGNLVFATDSEALEAGLPGFLVPVRDLEPRE
jgi:hypothetical protein